MDNNNWRPIQSGEPTMETSDWRTALQPDECQRNVNTIMDTLKKHLPFSGQEGLHELKKIAVRFEEKIYTAATSQSDYRRKISLKMLSMDTKSQNTMASSLPSKPDPGSLGMQSQVPNQAQSLPMQMTANPSQTPQQLLSQNIQNSAGVQSSAGLSSALPPASSLAQPSVPSVVSQNPNMQNMPATSQNAVGNTMGQSVPSNMFARPMHGRQQVLPQQQQQQQQQSQNQSQYIYQQQLHNPLLKQKFPQANIPQTMIQSHNQQQQQQQQQQNLLQPTQLQSSQQTVMQTSSAMQPSMMQSSLSSLQPNQQPTKSMLQQHQQSILRQPQQPQQSSVVHQQQTSMAQQAILPPQQQQQQQLLMGQQPNATNMQQTHLIGQQNNVGDMQQQQRLQGQQNNLSNLQQQQQQQQQRQQQFMAQQSNLSNMHQQELGPQSSVTGLQQQQQLLGSQTGNSSMQTNQHSVHMLQQSKAPGQQQPQQSASTLLPTQGQQSQPQQSQQQLLSQIQSQAPQMQQQLGLQQQPNPLQRDMPQRLQPSGQGPGSLLQQQNVIDQQKQLYQSQRALPETSSTSLDSTAQTGHASGGDWKEEVYQKIKRLKDLYFADMNEMYQKIALKLQQHDSLQQPETERLEKLRLFKAMLDKCMAFLQLNKNSILIGHKDKLPLYEKQIGIFFS